MSIAVMCVVVDFLLGKTAMIWFMGYAVTGIIIGFLYEICDHLNKARETLKNIEDLIRNK